jgi:hypothetical protein
MRGSIVLTFVALGLGLLWYQTPAQKQDVIGLRADGKPLYEPLIVAAGTPVAPASKVDAMPTPQRGVAGLMPQHRWGRSARY